MTLLEHRVTEYRTAGDQNPAIVFAAPQPLVDAAPMNSNIRKMTANSVKPQKTLKIERWNPSHS